MKPVSWKKLVKCDGFLENADADTTQESQSALYSSSRIQGAREKWGVEEHHSSWGERDMGSQRRRGGTFSCDILFLTAPPYFPSCDLDPHPWMWPPEMLLWPMASLGARNGVQFTDCHGKESISEGRNHEALRANSAQDHSARWPIVHSIIIIHNNNNSN